MAEYASDADLKTTPATTLRSRQRGEAAALSAPLRTDAQTPRSGARANRAEVPVETAADRYAFYLFMGTITLGVLAMIAMAFAL